MRLAGPDGDGAGADGDWARARGGERAREKMQAMGIRERAEEEDEAIGVVLSGPASGILRVNAFGRGDYKLVDVGDGTSLA